MFIISMDKINKDEYDQLYQCAPSAPIAGKREGKWGFVGVPDSFIYVEIRLYYGMLVGIKEDGAMDCYGRYLSH